MTTGRNSDGRFGKGHGGFKPKGAVSRKSHRRELLLNHVLEMLGGSLAESLPTMPPKQVMKLYLELLKLSVPKMARIKYVPDPPDDPVAGITFNVVHSDTTNPRNQ